MKFLKLSHASDGYFAKQIMWVFLSAGVVFHNKLHRAEANMPTFASDKKKKTNSRTTTEVEGILFLKYLRTVYN